MSVRPTTPDILREIQRLPSLPVIVMELLQSFECGDIDSAELAEKVGRDQALAARTLGLANSSFYGLSRKVTTIRQAITVLGFDAVRTLVTASGVMSQFKADQDNGGAVLQFWSHSIATALTARFLAAEIGQNPNICFLGGLLHDIGRLVMVTRFPEEYLAVRSQQSDADGLLTGAEKSVFGMDHVQAGRMVAEAWRFPIALVQAIATHHTPTTGGDLSGAVVHLADACVHAMDIVGDENECVPPVSELAWKLIETHQLRLDGVLSRAESEFEGACRNLIS